MGAKSALIAGASGLIGSALLHDLLAAPEYDRVVAIVRSPLYIEHPKLQQVVVDFGNLSTYHDAFRVDDIFCCLGTTIKKARTKEAFRQVDLDYPVAMGRLGRICGVRQFLIVTSMGADTDSAFFYNRVKGQVEAEINAMGLPSLHVFRPSLLLGNRRDRRPGERIASVISRMIPWVGPLRKYAPIEGQKVARAMLQVAREGAAGPRVYESNEIARIAAGR